MLLTTARYACAMYMNKSYDDIIEGLAWYTTTLLRTQSMPDTNKYHHIDIDINFAVTP